MSANIWWSTKVGAKLQPDLFIFSIYSAEIPLYFHESIWSVLLKYLMYFLAGINTKIFWNTPEEKYFASLRILSLFTKSFLNPFFFDIFLTCFDNSVSSFLIEVKFLAYHQNLSLYKINNIIFSC